MEREAGQEGVKDIAIEGERERYWQRWGWGHVKVKI